jgi:peptide/nickel transport system permease protein
MSIQSLFVGLVHHRLGRIGLAILVVVATVALFANRVSPYDPYNPLERGPRKLRPSREHPLGTDGQGRDILSQLIYGARVSLTVGLATAILVSGLAATMGVLAGYLKGTVDTLIMRTADVLFAVPGLPLMLILAVYLGASMRTIVVIFTLVGWPGLARLIRSQVLSVRERPYVEAARAYGASEWRIMFRHVLPSVSSIITINGVMMAAGMMLAEAGLSFLGFGDPVVISWGKMLALSQQGHAMLFGMWWWVIPPGLAIFFTALGFMLLGLALEEELNPLLRRGQR